MANWKQKGDSKGIVSDVGAQNQRRIFFSLTAWNSTVFSASPAGDGSTSILDDIFYRNLDGW
jgi:hypothetical protein